MGFFYIIGMGFNVHSNRRIQLQRYSDEHHIDIFKFYFFACEALFLPLLVNVAWPGMCKFQSNREDIEVLDCGSTFKNRQWYAWILKVLVVIAYIFAVAYNLRLFLYVKKEQKRKRAQFLHKKH